MCVQTASAWYRVLAPTPEYHPLFFLCRLFAELCHASLAAVRDAPAVDLDAFLVLLCRHLLTKYPKEHLLYHVQVRFRCIPVLSMRIVPTTWQMLVSPSETAASSWAVLVALCCTDHCEVVVVSPQRTVCMWGCPVYLLCHVLHETGCKTCAFYCGRGICRCEYSRARAIQGS